MLVWEGDQKHLPPFIIQTSSKRERREEGVRCNRPAGLECCRRSEAHGRQAGSTVDDRMMLTAARREGCRPCDAHGRPRGVLFFGVCSRRQAGSAVDDPPTAPRPPHTLCGHRRRCDTSPRGSAERSAPPSSPESAAERPFGESSTSCTEYRGEFSAPKAFVPPEP